MTYSFRIRRTALLCTKLGKCFIKAGCTPQKAAAMQGETTATGLKVFFNGPESALTDVSEDLL